jgi:hypothetical protein
MQAVCFVTRDAPSGNANARFLFLLRFSLCHVGFL